VRRTLTATFSVLLAVAACNSTSAPERTVRGTVRIVGGPAPGLDHVSVGPVQVTATPHDGGKVVIATADTGTFELHLNDGTYDVQGGPTDIGLPQCSAVETVVVSATTAPIELVCPLL
jgi:hypothetical protein